MLDVYKITSTLERLDDAALQRYAAMHKQDPYTLSLAVEESNRRKRMRAAPQESQQSVPVNEQAVQGMAPEDTGIAQLPAGDMEFADGGIIAFADGAEVVDPQQPAALADYYRLMRPSGGAAGETPDRTGIATLDDYYRLMRSSGGVPATPEEAAAPSGETMRAVRDVIAAPVASGIGTPPGPKPPAGGGVSMGTSMRERVSGGIPQTGPTALAQINELIKTLPQEDPEAARLREAAKREALQAQETAAAEYLAARPQGKTGEEQRARLEKEEAAVPEKEEKNLKMSLINAGLAMMAGTSPYALANIGAGGAQGVKTYQEGLKDLEKAAERRQDLFAKIEQAQRAEQEGRAEKGLALREQAAGIETKYNDSRIAAIEKMYGVNRETARQIVTTQMQVDSADRRAAMQERGATARAEISGRRSDTQQQRYELVELGKSYRARLDSVDKQLANPMAQFSPGDKAAAMQERAALLRGIQTVENSLAGGMGIPTAPPDAGAPTSGWGQPKVVPTR
jgi:hypothetical protein